MDHEKNVDVPLHGIRHTSPSHKVKASLCRSATAAVVFIPHKASDMNTAERTIASPKRKIYDRQRQRADARVEHGGIAHGRAAQSTPYRSRMKTRSSSRSMPSGSAATSASVLLNASLRPHSRSSAASPARN